MSERGMASGMWTRVFTHDISLLCRDQLALSTGDQLALSLRGCLRGVSPHWKV
jgi:hypothetical protein